MRFHRPWTDSLKKYETERRHDEYRYFARTKHCGSPIIIIIYRRTDKTRKTTTKRRNFPKEHRAYFYIAKFIVVFVVTMTMLDGQKNNNKIIYRIMILFLARRVHPSVDNPRNDRFSFARA